MYLYHITLADSAPRSTETVTAALALARCIPPKDATDSRGWEWYYLNHWFQADRRRFTGHSPQWVTHLAFSPDGTVLASAGGGNLYYDNPGELSEPGQVILRDPGAGAVRHRLEGHQNLLTTLAFSGDDRRLASASVDRTIKVWDVTTGRSLATFTGPAHGRIVRLQFFPDGPRLACLSESDRVSLLEADTGRERHAFPGQSMTMSRDGTYLAVGFDQEVRVLEARAIRTKPARPGTAPGRPSRRWCGWGPIAAGRPRGSPTS